MRRMATSRTVNRPDVFPPGTVVTVLPVAKAGEFARLGSGPPPAGGTNVTADASGDIALTALTPGVTYALVGLVAGAYRWLRTASTTYAAPPRLPHPWTAPS
jgi:hypothetical protein